MGGSTNHTQIKRNNSWVISYNYVECVCLFVFQVTFKHLRLYCDGACLYQWYFDQCAATHECNASDTGPDTTPHHSIQTHWCGT